MMIYGSLLEVRLARERYDSMVRRLEGKPTAVVRRFYEVSRPHEGLDGFCWWFDTKRQASTKAAMDVLESRRRARGKRFSRLIEGLAQMPDHDVKVLVGLYERLGSEPLTVTYLATALFDTPDPPLTRGLSDMRVAENMPYVRQQLEFLCEHGLVMRGKERGFETGYRLP